MSFLKKIFKMRDSVAIVALLLLVSKLFGFLSFRLIAGFFGTPRELDIFWAAYIIPDTIFNILIAGSINAAVIPVFTDIKVQKGGNRFVKLFIGTTIFFGVLLFLSIASMYFYAPSIATFMLTNDTFGSVFESSEELGLKDRELMVTLIRILLATPFLLGLSSMATAFLQTHKRFFITTLAFLINNITMLLLSMLLVVRFGYGVEGLAWASVGGATAHLLIQMPLTIQFIREHLHIENLDNLGSRFNRYAREIWRIVALAIPRTLSYAVEHVNVIVNTLIGFSLGSGVLSAYKYAFQLHLFPVHIIAGAVSQVSLPNFSEEVSKGELKKFASQYQSAIKQVMFLMFPAAVVLLVLRLPIVRLVYGVGEFDWWDTVITSWALALLGGSLLAQGVVSITLRALFALKKTWLPLLISLVTLPINIFLSYYLTNFFSHYQDWRPILHQIAEQFSGGLESGGFTGVYDTAGSLFADLGLWFTTRNQFDAAVGGLSLSLSLTFLIEMVLLLFFLNRTVKVLDRALLRSIWKMIVNSVVMMLVMYFFYRFADFSLDTSRAVNVLNVFIVTLVPGGLAYLFASIFNGTEEVYIFVNSALYTLDRMYRSVIRFVDRLGGVSNG